MKTRLLFSSTLLLLGILLLVPETIRVNGQATPGFEMDTQTSLINIQQGSNSVSTQITLISLNGFSGAVALNPSESPPGGPALTMVPASVSLPAGGSTFSTLTLAVTSATPPGAYVVTVIGTSGAVSNSTQITVNVTPAPKPDFTLAVTPSSQPLPRDSSVVFTVSIMGTNGFNSTVNLSAKAAFGGKRGLITSIPSTVGPFSTSSLTVTAGRNTPEATFVVTVTATSGSLSHTASVTVTVTTR